MQLKGVQKTIKTPFYVQIPYFYRQILTFLPTFSRNNSYFFLTFSSNATCKPGDV